MPDFTAAQERRTTLLSTLVDLGADGPGASEAELRALTGVASRQSTGEDLRLFEEAGWITSDRGPRHHHRRYIITPKGARVKAVPKFGRDFTHAPLYRQVVPTFPLAPPDEPELPAATPQADPLDRVVSLVEEIKATRKHLAELEAELRHVIGGS